MSQGGKIVRLKRILIGTLMSVAVLVAPSAIYAQAYGTVATETLNVRDGAKLEANIVKQIGLGEPVEIVSENGDWLKLILADDSRAFVKAEYINIHRVLAVVDVNDGLNVRDYPSTEQGNIIGKFSSGDEISVQYRVGDWYKVSQDGFEGYVNKDYVKNGTDVDFLRYLPTEKLTDIKRMTVTQEEAQSVMVDSDQGSRRSSEGNSANYEQSYFESSGSATGDAVVAYASQFLGNPYVYGGNSLTGGVDCSGFTSQIMRHFGVSLNRSSSAQYANNGYHVSSDSLQKGDLIFYGYNGHVSHVAIYIGGGQVIHANDERTGICISNAFPSGGKPYIGAKRVL